MDTTQYTHLRGPGPQLVYRHSDGQTFTVVDRTPVGEVGPDFVSDEDNLLREKRICRALLQHALDMLNGEDTF